MLVAHTNLCVTLQEQFFVVADPVEHLEVFTHDRGEKKSVRDEKIRDTAIYTHTQL